MSKTTIMFITVLVLTVPTFGASLVIWVWLKSKYDDKNVKVILAMAKISYNNNGVTTLQGVNNGSIRRTFSYFGVEKYIDITVKSGFGYGYINHQALGKIYLTLQQASNNRLLISAVKDKDTADKMHEAYKPS